MRKKQQWLNTWIKNRRKRRYSKITRYRSDFQAGLKATIAWVESRILKQPEPWDIYFERCESPIERKLYRVLKKQGYHPKTQVTRGYYRIDIALHRYKIAIECDGYHYHMSKEQKKHDAKKGRFLRKKGWSVLRFTGSEINGKMPVVMRKIQKKINEKS